MVENIVIYSVASFSVNLFILFRLLVTVTGGIRACRTIFTKMIEALIDAPVNKFYDVTPTGRILNRLSTMKNLNTLHSKEFSSTMLPKVIFNRFEVSLYSTNHPNQTNYHEIMDYITIFKHKFTYESPFLRNVWGEKYFNICNEIRSFLNLSLLSNRSLLEIET